MASIEQRGKSFRIIFRFEGQRYTRSLVTRSEKVALGALHRLEDNLRRVELGTLTIPPDVDAADFLLSDGTQTGVEKPAPTRSPIRTLGKLCESYLASMPDGGRCSAANGTVMASLHTEPIQYSSGNCPLPNGSNATVGLSSGCPL